MATFLEGAASPLGALTPNRTAAPTPAAQIGASNHYCLTGFGGGGTILIVMASVSNRSSPMASTTT
jgi:hypothetical protein